MNLYLISQTENTGWDTYDSAVVAAESEEEAQRIAPEDGALWGWCEPEHVKVEYIGIAKPDTVAGTIICASFNAG